MPIPRNITDLIRKLKSYFHTPYSLFQPIIKKVKNALIVIGDRRDEYNRAPLNIVFSNARDYGIIGCMAGALVTGQAYTLRLFFNKQTFPCQIPTSTILGFTFVSVMAGVNAGIDEAVRRREDFGMDFNVNESPLLKGLKAYARAPKSLIDYPGTVIIKTFPPAVIGTVAGAVVGLLANVSRIMLNAELFGGDAATINAPMTSDDFNSLAKFGFVGAAYGIAYGLVKATATIEKQRHQNIPTLPMSTTRFLLQLPKTCRDTVQAIPDLPFKMVRGIKQARTALQHDPSRVMMFTVIPAEVIGMLATIAAAIYMANTRSRDEFEYAPMIYAGVAGFFAAAIPGFQRGVNSVNERIDFINRI